MEKPMFKRIADLQVGDIVRAHGGEFRVIESARDSIGHSRWADLNGLPIGPAGVAHAPAVCVSGTVPGYFWPGSDWAFQGATFVTVEVINQGGAQ